MIAAGGVLTGAGVVVGGPAAAVDAGVVPPVRAVASGAAPSRPAAAAGPPVRLRIPAQGLDAAVVAVAVTEGGGLGVPDDPALVGWWRDGATPGDHVGSVVLDGHVDSHDRGRGALFELARLRPGDAVQLVLDTGTADHTADYTVAAVRSYRKADLPPEVFDRTGPARLVLISCGGPFDRARRSYRDNVVVYGVPVDRAVEVTDR